jgi:hypothetical protein
MAALFNGVGMDVMEIHSRKSQVRGVESLHFASLKSHRMPVKSTAPSCLSVCLPLNRISAVQCIDPKLAYNMLTRNVMDDMYCAVLYRTDTHQTSAEEGVRVFPTKNVNDVVSNNAMSYRTVSYSLKERVPPRRSGVRKEA